MNKFAVYFRGKNPSENQLTEFIQDYLGISQKSLNFDWGETDEDYMCVITDIFNEYELDSKSIFWEFIKLNK